MRCTLPTALFLSHVAVATLSTGPRRLTQKTQRSSTMVHHPIQSRTYSLEKFFESYIQEKVLGNFLQQQQLQKQRYQQLSHPFQQQQRMTVFGYMVESIPSQTAPSSDIELEPKVQVREEGVHVPAARAVQSHPA